MKYTTEKENLNIVFKIKDNVSDDDLRSKNLKKIGNNMVLGDITEIKEPTDYFEEVNEIAEKVGYQDTRYFSKLFKKNIGIKPSEYRKIYG